ncbi:glycosyltransferase [Polaribacter porphyrae]|uniref:Glycosyl transferase family 2 n=1 Tax=Polaribacter porphyrae TaxID=1137780 RepID=A0A2S7WS51_9FLAO|nr:glycosyltransferase [Polaribacter porphyrae]PQJ80419.1 glycosyl transferase family 2 [Polaribacter porphyrae]
MENIVITGSIVLYKENLAYLHKTVDSFLNIPLPNKKLFLIDNTSDKFYQYVLVEKNIEYIPVEDNIGFGSAHNRVIYRINRKSDYHLILNPDVSFKPKVIPKLIYELNKKDNVCVIAPKVLFPNEKHQYSCRRYPSISELIARRFNFLAPLFKKTIQKGQYQDKDLTKPFFPEYITGCFHLYKTEDFVNLGGFDERYFLYMEDIDICKKIDKIGKKKLYYPQEEIIHVLKQGSSKSLKLFFRHTSSAIKYFLKWGF